MGVLFSTCSTPLGKYASFGCCLCCGETIAVAAASAPIVAGARFAIATPLRKYARFFDGLGPGIKSCFAINLIGSQSWPRAVTMRDILIGCRAPFLSALLANDGQCDSTHLLPGVSAALKELAKVFMRRP